MNNNSKCCCKCCYKENILEKKSLLYYIYIFDDNNKIRFLKDYHIIRNDYDIINVDFEFCYQRDNRMQFDDYQKLCMIFRVICNDLRYNQSYNKSYKYGIGLVNGEEDNRFLMSGV